MEGTDASAAGDGRRRARGEGPGGIVHTYQRFDPKNFPSPTAPPPDLAGAAMEHMMRFGSMRRLTPEELARAVRLDPSQIAGLGPSLETIMAMLEERKRRILATYETRRVLEEAGKAYRERAEEAAREMGKLPKGQRDRDAGDGRADEKGRKEERGKERRPSLDERVVSALRGEQLRDLEKLWYAVGDDDHPAARALLGAMERLGEKYQVEELVAKYTFTGREQLSVEQALAVKEELEAIDRLLAQLREAMQNAQIGVIDLEELAQFAEPGDMERLGALQQQIEDYLREQAELQGLEMTREGYQLTPRAMRLFQAKLLREIFDDLQAARSGRHEGPVSGEGAVELPRTRGYEFGDSASQMDVAQSVVNGVAREGKGSNEATERRPSSDGAMRAGSRPRVSLRTEDLDIHLTKNNPKCATVVAMDMSGSMRYDGQYVNCKRMALALDGLIRREYPGDFLRFVEMYTFAKVRAASEVPELLPKPVTVHAPVVRLRADMSKPEASEVMIPPHFTNIQQALRVSRQLLAGQDTPNRQIVLITDGLPTAHFDGPMLYMLYPPDKSTEEATMREGRACAREGITINVFLLPNWAQSSEDIGFAHKLAEETRGRVFFTAGKDVDRYVLWDYVRQRRVIIG